MTSTAPSPVTFPRLQASAKRCGLEATPNAADQEALLIAVGDNVVRIVSSDTAIRCVSDYREDLGDHGSAVDGDALVRDINDFNRAHPSPMAVYIEGMDHVAFLSSAFVGKGATDEQIDAVLRATIDSMSAAHQHFAETRAAAGKER